MPANKKAPPKSATSRADFGAPIDGFFRKQAPHLRAILEELRRLVEKAAPDAGSSLKWGMPCFTLAGNMMCMLGGHKTHVNLVLVGREGTFDDPQGRLEGSSKGGRHLKLSNLDELPRASVLKWVRAAAKNARAKEKTA